MTDKNGQPLPILNWRHRTVREVDELVGLCRGILADGLVNEAEAQFLREWLEHNRETRDTWPCSVLYPRIQAMLVDGLLQEHEEHELLQLLMHACGGKASSLGAQSLSSTLPLDNPPPVLSFPGRVFCFTGKLLCGTRSACETEVTNRGGAVTGRITQDLSFLVVGTIGSRDWLHSTFGRKIEAAIALRDRGFPLGIVSEEHFVESLA